MDNQQILEWILEYIKNEVQNGNGEHYSSIMEVRKSRRAFEKSVKDIVETGEKKQMHTDPEEYTLEDIIHLVIQYEMARESGNADVFLDAVEDELECIKQGTLFRQYAEMFDLDVKAFGNGNFYNGASGVERENKERRGVPSQHVTSYGEQRTNKGETVGKQGNNDKYRRTADYPRTTRDNGKGTQADQTQIRTIGELKLLGDQQFIEALLILFEKIPKGTEIEMYWNEEKIDTKSYKEWMRGRISRKGIVPFPSNPNICSWEELVQIALEYVQAKNQMEVEDYLAAIKEEIQIIRRSVGLKTIWQAVPSEKRIISNQLHPEAVPPEKRITPKQLNPGAFPTTLQRVNTAAKEMGYSSRPYYYTIGDLHGWIAPLEQAVTHLEQEHGGNYKLIVLGDCIDRGPYGLGILKYLMNLGDKVELMMGNHEKNMKRVFDTIKGKNRGPRGEINWTEVIDDLKYMVLEELKRENRDTSDYREWTENHRRSFQKKGYQQHDYEDLKNWMDTKNGGKQTILRIIGPLPNLIASLPIADEEVVSPEELRKILEYIDGSASLVAINDVRNPNEPQNAKSVLLAHSAPGNNWERLQRLRQGGPGLRKIPIGSCPHDVIGLREEEYRNNGNKPDLLYLAASAGFDEFIHGHEPVKGDEKVKSEVIKYRDGKKIRFTSLDGGLNQQSRDLAAVANLYCINTGEVKQYNRYGEARKTIHIGDTEGR